MQQVISPIDGSVYTEYALASDAAIQTALERAVAAQAAWKHVPLAERGAVCRRMTAWMVERADDVGTQLTWQTGRPVAQSPFEIRRGFGHGQRVPAPGHRQHRLAAGPRAAQAAAGPVEAPPSGHGTVHRSDPPGPGPADFAAGGGRGTEVGGRA